MRKWDYQSLYLLPLHACLNPIYTQIFPVIWAKSKMSKLGWWHNFLQVVFSLLLSWFPKLLSSLNILSSQLGDPLTQITYISSHHNQINGPNPRHIGNLLPPGTFFVWVLISYIDFNQKSALDINTFLMQKIFY